MSGCIKCMERYEERLKEKQDIINELEAYNSMLRTKIKSIWVEVSNEDNKSNIDNDNTPNAFVCDNHKEAEEVSSDDRTAKNELRSPLYFQ